MNALGMIEVQSIPLGVNAGDAMLKAATVQLVTAQPIYFFLSFCTMIC